MIERLPQREVERRARRRRARAVRGRAGSTVLSLLFHAAILLSLLLAVRPEAPRLVEDQPIQVSLIEGISLGGAAGQPAVPTPPVPPSPPKPLEQRKSRLPAPARATVEPKEEEEPSPPAVIAELSASQLASAATVGTGSGAAGDGPDSAGNGNGGGACDVARWLQAALRKDPEVQAALSAAQGSNVMVWNEDWIRHGGQDGEGLAVVREAILMEVLATPAHCRTKPMKGLVLLAPTNGRGPRIAVGADSWRWADLLIPRGGVAGHPTTRR